RETLSLCFYLINISFFWPLLCIERGMKFFILMILSSLFVSCGKNIHFETPSDLIETYMTPAKDGLSELEYSYQLDGVSEGVYCSTGHHKFKTFGEVCKALLNDQLNNSCAQDTRIELYNSHNCKSK